MDIEILREGIWNGVNITRKVMEQMVENFTRFKDYLKVPLKFGHDPRQPLTDGMPAIGILDKIWINDHGTMMASAVDMPEIVQKAVEKKLYRNVSIEASLDVKYKGEKVGAVLTGLGLLGAELPAVNTLNDLQAYLSASNDIEFSRRIELSAFSGNNKPKEFKVMDEEEYKALIAKLEAELATEKSKGVKLSAEQETLQADIDRLKKDQAAVKFSADKKSLEDDMEALVKAKVITPAQRDKFAAQATDENTLTSVRMSVDVLKEGMPNKGAAEDEQGKDLSAEDKANKDMAPDQVLHAKALKLSAENKVSFSSAVKTILKTEPELAEEYTSQYDKEEAA